MSAAASPGPNNLLILAVLGIGAYYLMTRRAYAQPVYQTGVRPTTTTAERVSLIAAGANAVGGLLSRLGGSGGSVPLLGTWDGRAAQPWLVTPQGPDGPRYNNPSAYVANDGVAVSPVNVSAFDYLDNVSYLG